jgi:hypothetical protein
MIPHPFYLPAGGPETAVVVCPVVPCLAQSVHGDNAEASQAPHATAQTFPRTHTVCRSDAKTSVRRL